MARFAMRIQKRPSGMGCYGEVVVGRGLLELSQEDQEAIEVLVQRKRAKKAEQRSRRVGESKPRSAAQRAPGTTKRPSSKTLKTPKPARFPASADAGLWDKAVQSEAGQALIAKATPTADGNGT